MNEKGKYGRSLGLIYTFFCECTHILCNSKIMQNHYTRESNRHTRANFEKKKKIYNIKADSRVFMNILLSFQCV